MRQDDDTLDLDLRLANRAERTRFFVGRAVRQPRLNRPLKQMAPRGIYVPPPPSDHRQAVVKVWPAKATTTAAHSRYLQHGKGPDGTDASLFGADGYPIDRQAFAVRAQEDPHQFRLIIALVPPVILDWVGFTQRFMQQMSHDVHSKLDALCSVHHDTHFPHVHVQLRARLDDGTPLYFTKDYYFHGLRFRGQQLATAMLGRVSPQQAAHERRWLPIVADDVTATDPPRKPRTLSRDEVTHRLAETQARVQRFKRQMHQRAQRTPEPD